MVGDENGKEFFEDDINYDLEWKRSSIPVPFLEEDERILFKLVEDGLVAETEKFLKENPDVNINSFNYQGLTPLLVAVNTENVAMTKMFLERTDIEIMDALLHAVATEHLEIVTLLLDAMREKAPNMEYCGTKYSSEFSAEVTPLHVATQKGNFIIVSLLLERGHRVERPHIPSCLCNVCKEGLKSRFYDLASWRMNCYRAISSPIYVSLTADDPIIATFLLQDELELCTNMDEQYHVEYVVMCRELREFAVDLISLCESQLEVKIMLSRDTEFSDTRYIHTVYPTLYLALEHEQKEFVAHSKVQQLVHREWKGYWLTWAHISLVGKVIHLLVRLIAFPFTWLFPLCFPNSKLTTKLVSPVGICLNDMASHIIFCVLVFTLINLDKTRSSRGPPRTGLEWVIVVWVAGFILNTARHVWLRSMKTCIRSMWNWYDMFMEAVFLMTFVFWIKAYFDSDCVVERKYWSSFDATLIHEALLAIASILTCGRLMYFCQHSRLAGPIQDNVNVEWKFARTKMFLTYIDGIILCPSPFNLIYYFILLCYKKSQKYERLSNYWSLPASLKDINLGFDDYCRDPEHYEALMDEIIRRYFREKNPHESAV
ncbi:short transient receptor potential channel 4-like isoform X2 [Tachypleus tridentatus]|uniref:short transient receptor potential channel 4-like isoform X2 n=1 Tax=Tachypleus tridentatus TaxID=6853 RepID=UPI003FD17801